MTAPALHRGIPRDALFRARVPNAVVDCGLLGAVPHDPTLWAYWLLRALDNERRWSYLDGPAFSARCASPWLQQRLGCSSRSISRVLRKLHQWGWIRRDRGWIVVGNDKDSGERLYFFDAWLKNAVARSRGGKPTSSARQMRRRAAAITELLDEPRTATTDVRAAPRSPYTLVDLARERLDSAAHRGALATAVALYRYTFLKPACSSSSPDYRETRRSQELLCAILGTSRDTLARWTTCAEEQGLLEVISQGHRKRNLYRLPTRVDINVREGTPYFAQRVAESSGASDSLRTILERSRPASGRQATKPPP